MKHRRTNGRLGEMTAIPLTKCFSGEIWALQWDLHTASFDISTQTNSWVFAKCGLGHSLTGDWLFHIGNSLFIHVLDVGRCIHDFPLNIHSFPNATLNHGAVSSTLFNFKSDSLLFTWTGCSLQFSIPDRKKVRIYPLWKANFSYSGNPSSGNLFTAAAWRLILSVTSVPQKHQAELTDAYMSW